MTTKDAPLIRYGAAVVSVGVALALCLPFRPLFEASFLFVFLAACVFSVRYGGIGPGLLAIVLSVLAADYFLLPPQNVFTVGLPDFILLLIFAATALVVELIYESLRRARMSLEAKRDELELLQNVTAALGEATTLEQVADVIVNRAYKALGAGTGTVFRVLEDGETMEMLNYRLLPPDVAQQYRYAPISMKAPLTDAIRTGQPIFIESRDEYIGRYPQFADNIRQNQSQATACLPLFEKGRVIGGITLSFPKPMRMTKEFTALLIAVGQQCAQAMGRAQVYAHEQRTRERLHVTLTSIGDAVITTDQNGHIVLMNAVAEALTGWTMDAASGKPLNEVFLILNEETRAEVESPVEVVMQSGAIVGLANHSILITRDGREIPIDDSGAPIYDENKNIVGVILVFRDITERRRAEARTAALQRMTAAFSQAVTVADVARIAITQSAAALNAHRGLIALLNETEDALTAVSYHNLPPAALEIYRSFPLDAKMATADALHNNEPIWLETYPEYMAVYPNLQGNPIAAEIEALAAVPLHWNGKNRGTFTFGFSQPQVFDQDYRAFIMAIAQQCAQALERAQLYETERTARERMTFLAEAGAMLVSSLDYDTTLKHIARFAVPRIADWCSLDVIDDSGELQQLIVTHTDEEKEELVTRWREYRMKQSGDREAVMGMIQSRKTLVYPHITPEMIENSEADEESKAILRQLNLRAAMYVPMYVRGRSLGLLSFGSSDSGRTFTDEDVRLAEELGRRASVAIENARHYREAQSQRERLSVTLSSIGDAVIATDAKGRISFINAVAESVTGWKADDVNGKPLAEVFNIISEATRKPVQSPYEKVIETGAIVGLANHTILITRDGREVPVDDSGAPIHDENGQIIGVIIVFRDISERRRAEIRAEALQRLTAAFSEAATIEQIASVVATQGVAALDADMGVVVMVNEEHTELHPVAHHNFRQRLLEDYPSTPLNEPYGMTDVFHSGEALWFESLEAYGARYPHFVERLRMEAIQAFAFVPLRIRGSTAGVLNIIFEEPHRFDAAERELIMALAQECGQAMERAQLYEAEQAARMEAEEANRLKMRFLGMISHELRTPLTSIKGFATTLLASDVTFEPDQQRRFVEVIDEEADKLT
jgi:PAS domain S-box-containing protein